MSFYQSSIINRYLNAQNKIVSDNAFDIFAQYFHDPEIQKNIRAAKEEQFQEGFLRELFVNVLGYTLNPQPNYNLTTELKNEKGAKKTDGAILCDGKALGVIELKGTNTTNLDKVNAQAFNYKNNQTGCVYVITSNFEKLRFFIHDAVEHIEFNLFTLTKKQFELLWFCLCADNLLGGIPEKAKQESIVAEEMITKQLYKDYADFKNDLWSNMVKKNHDTDQLLLYKKAQKLLDRLLFILFSEDSGLLPPNSITRIESRWSVLKEEDAYKPLYEILKQYFCYINKGKNGKTSQDDIFAYNGGLFRPDDILDSIIIDDDVLHHHIMKLTAYDFQSEIDVNILGHIFENSLNDIENVKARLAGQEVSKRNTKRKKDGIYYTPKYITKYIVDNTVGILCEEKKSEYFIDDEEYAKGSKGRKKQTIEKLHRNLNTYRDWLLNITICDLACGSGAFLNQALDFLIKEHAYIDELESKLFGSGFVFRHVSDHILENNLFGVDINAESVEIAKLSLWLRTSEKGRKLTSLNNNIKCGNSLIDDPEVADNALNWKKEFPDVFEKGGFDIVIGNPPYVNAIELKKSLPDNEYKYLKKKYKTAKGTVDLYIYFFEKGLNITKSCGFLSYITPNRFLSASYGKALRDLLINESQITNLIDYSDKSVFPDVSTYPVISIIRNVKRDNYYITSGKFHDLSRQTITLRFPSHKLGILSDYILGFLLNDKLQISEKIIKQGILLDNSGKINATSTAKESDEYSSLINQQDGYKLVNTGTIDPYCTMWSLDQLTNKGKMFLKPFLPNDSHVISKNRHRLYKSPKIIISKIGLQCEAFYDIHGEFASINTNCIHSFNIDYLPEYICCWLNSKLYNYMFECFFDGLRMSGGYLLYSAPNLKNTYIYPINTVQQKPFADKSIRIANLLKQINDHLYKFRIYFQAKYEINKLPKKLKNWHELDFADFISEINKSIKKNGGVKLSIKDEMDWIEVFEAKKSEAVHFKNDIELVNNEINQMFYTLFGLTEKEIISVEQA